MYSEPSAPELLLSQNLQLDSTACFATEITWHKVYPTWNETMNLVSPVWSSLMLTLIIVTPILYLTMYHFSCYISTHPSEMLTWLSVFCFWSSCRVFGVLFDPWYLLQACHLSHIRLYHESHVFSASLTVSQPHKLISRVVHFGVWITTNAILMVPVTPILYLKECKMWLGVGNRHRILFSTEEGCIFMRLNKLCKQHRLVLRLFPNWNRQSSCSVWGLQVILLGPHPPDNPVSRFLD